MSLKRFRRARLIASLLLAFVLCFSRGGLSQPQTFTSGSTGADGALNITAPGVTYFNPAALNLNPAIPNIFNFTTINIAAGSTLKLTEEVFHGPVFFLATGNVSITGTLDLSGAAGSGSTDNQSLRQISYGGSGGYNGGLGGGAGAAPSAGSGPGGGTAGTTGIGGNGTFISSQYLVPLVGGSGGGGGFGGCGNNYGGGGGAGGGAILIASSTSITLNGPSIITAQGGDGACNGGQGSGGAIRLVSNTVTSTCGNGCPLINVLGGNRGNPGGQIRIESFSSNITGNNTTQIGRAHV